MRDLATTLEVPPKRGAKRVAPCLADMFLAQKEVGWFMVSCCHGVVLFLAKSFWDSNRWYWLILMILIDDINDDIDDSTFKDLSIHINSHHGRYIWPFQPLAAHNMVQPLLVPLGQAKRTERKLRQIFHVKSTTCPLEIWLENGWKWLIVTMFICFQLKDVGWIL